MADATQELMLRVRGDNSGVDKAVAGTERAVKKLAISGEKAGGAFKNFSRSLAEARNASDVASSAAESLSQIVGKSLVGAVAIGAVKLFTDQITRMGEMLKETATNAQKSFDDIEKAGNAMNLSEAIAQTASLDTNITAINNKLSELNRSPFQNFIAGATGAKTELEALLKTETRLRDFKLAEGITAQNINEERLAGLTEEERQLDAISEEYKKRNKEAESITNPAARKQFQEQSGEIYARDRNALIDKQAKARADKEAELKKLADKNAKESAESQIKFDKMVFDAEQKLADQAVEREKKSEQERVQRKIDNNNRIYREDRYNTDEKIKMDTNADDTRFKRLVRDAYRAREEQKKASQTASDVSGGVLGSSRAGKQALDVARKQRERQLKAENYKVGQKLAPTQRDREKMAAQQAAGEMPSLGERIQGGLSGVDPSQLARESAASKFEKDRAFGKASASQSGKPGEEQSSLTAETLTAIQELVTLIKSGTVVK
jgi:hypothetical protein